MAIYAVGDLQGCHDALMRLVDLIRFDPRQDRLWFVGDLVNRGRRSLEVLRWMRAHDGVVTTVLGNHDLHLLAVAAGVATHKEDDTLRPILEAHDRHELLAWLSRRPMIHREGGFTLVHAGLRPEWSLEEAQQRAREVEALLKGPAQASFLAYLRSKHRDILPRSTASADFARARESLVALTRIRYLKRDGRPSNDFKGPPDIAPRDLHPWFRHPTARWRQPGNKLLFGHWSALGLYADEHVIGLDTGYVWGRYLTAYRLEDGHIVQIAADLE